MFLCDLSLSGFVGANATAEVSRRAQYDFTPNRMRCRDGGVLLLTSLRFNAKEQLASTISVPLQFFAPESFGVRLVLAPVKAKQLVTFELVNPTNEGVRFRLELGRIAG